MKKDLYNYTNDDIWISEFPTQRDEYIRSVLSVMQIDGGIDDKKVQDILKSVEGCDFRDTALILEDKLKEH